MEAFDLLYEANSQLSDSDSDENDNFDEHIRKDNNDNDFTIIGQNESDPLGDESITDENNETERTYTNLETRRSIVSNLYDNSDDHDASESDCNAHNSRYQHANESDSNAHGPSDHYANQSDYHEHGPRDYFSLNEPQYVYDHSENQSNHAEQSQDSSVLDHTGEEVSQTSSESDHVGEMQSQTSSESDQAEEEHSQVRKRPRTPDNAYHNFIPKHKLPARKYKINNILKH